MEIQSFELERLREIAFITGSRILKCEEDAEDIAQVSIIKLLDAEGIKNSEAWIRRVSKNLSCNMIREKISNRKKIKTLEIKSEDKNTPVDIISKSKIFRLLGSERYKIYKNYLSNNCSIKKCAEELGIGYSLCASKINDIKRDIKAKMLSEKGWGENDCIDSKTYNKIYQFIYREITRKNNKYGFIKYHSFYLLHRLNKQLIFIEGENENGLKIVLLDARIKRRGIDVKTVNTNCNIRKISNIEYENIVGNV